MSDFEWDPERAMIREAGEKATRNRVWVLRYMRSAEGPQTLGTVSKALPHINRSIIYRSLKVLAECGLLSEVPRVVREASYTCAR